MSSSLIRTVGFSSLGSESSTLKAYDLQLELLAFAKSDYDPDNFSEHVERTFEPAQRISDISDSEDASFSGGKPLFSEMAA